MTASTTESFFLKEWQRQSRGASHHKAHSGRRIRVSIADHCDGGWSVWMRAALTGTGETAPTRRNVTADPDLHPRCASIAAASQDLAAAVRCCSHVLRGALVRHHPVIPDHSDSVPVISRLLASLWIFQVYAVCLDSGYVDCVVPDCRLGSGAGVPHCQARFRTMNECAKKRSTHYEENT